MSELKSLKIATRESPLALVQANWVADRLRELMPALHVELVPMSTRGDQILDKTLSKVGGKGLFIKELETALAEGRADIAVHSLKDVSMILPKGFSLAAICPREDPRDAVVMLKHSSLHELPAGSKVGTASLRRAIGLKRVYPALDFVPVRGNVGSRLKKLEAGDYSALILAVAGLKRLGLTACITQILDTEHSLPSPGQGAIAIEVCDSNEAVAELIAELDDTATALCCLAERAVSRALGGNCSLPLAAHAVITDAGQLHLRAWLAAEDGTQFTQAEALGELDDPEGLGRLVAQKLSP
jgi:hydroxymethylbilane synthase